MKYCHRCSQYKIFYKSVNYMCRECWADYQRQRRLQKLKDVPFESQGRKIIDEKERTLVFHRTWSNMEQAKGYIGALIDGEGHIQFYPYGGKSIQIANTDLGIIQAGCEALNTLKVPYKVRKDVRYSKKRDKRYKDCYTIFIYRQENFRLLQEKVPIFDTNKSVRLKEMLASYKQQPSVRPSFNKGGDAHVLTG